jgi:hypothetical protein
LDAVKIDMATTNTPKRTSNAAIFEDIFKFSKIDIAHPPGDGAVILTPR